MNTKILFILIKVIINYKYAFNLLYHLKDEYGKNKLIPIKISLLGLVLVC